MKSRSKTRQKHRVERYDPKLPKILSQKMGAGVYVAAHGEVAGVSLLALFKEKKEKPRS